MYYLQGLKIFAVVSLFMQPKARRPLPIWTKLQLIYWAIAKKVNPPGRAAGYRAALLILLAISH
ncbi:MAG: hypothetical protein JWM58_483 [Rhizobium sp.]|nr:hypothetical protein [Rhizobium sp.]